MKTLHKHIIFIFLLLIAFHSNGQSITTESDSINPYHYMILELENSNLSVDDLLQDNSFLSRLEQDGYEKDSLVFYWEKFKASMDEELPIVETNMSISILAKSYRDSIVLRWAPNNETFWKNINQVGYSLVRSENMIDGSEVNRVVLVDSVNTLKPWTIDRIEAEVKVTDTAAMIATQALYGETMETEASESNLDFGTRNNVNQMQFGFALMMADRSELAAEVMGLRFVDKDVEPGKNYSYTLFVKMGENLKAATTYIRNDPNVNPKIVGLTIKEEDSKITLMWPRDYNNFSGYWIERSPDAGSSWQATTDDVIIFIDNEDERIRNKVDDILISTAPDPTDGMSAFFIYVDSTVNDVSYQYRISGQTPFADFSDYAYIDAMSSDLTPPPIPLVTSHGVNEDNNLASVEWTMDYDDEYLADLAGFSIWESNQSDGEFVQVSGLLDRETRTYTSEDTLSKNQTHYYLLKAFDKSGNESSSFPMYMHVIDDVPPSAPIETVAEIDSNGIVTIYWTQNQEPDLLGYRVYFANDRSYELTQITPEPIGINQFIDSIVVKSLSEEIYYRVQAVDKSHNRSEYSDWIIVKRPDIIPPVAPILFPPSMNDSIIVLDWKPSSSIDVVLHQIYRRPYQKGLDWELIQEVTATDTTFTDLMAEVDILYEYTMLAQDDAELLSPFAFPVKARRWFDNEELLVLEPEVEYDETLKVNSLKWEYIPSSAKILDDQEYYFYIYKSKQDFPLTRYRIVEGTERAFVDQNITNETAYNYAIKVVYANGKVGILTNTISITTPK